MQLAEEQKGLQDRLNQATMTRLELLALEREQILPENRALFDQVVASEEAANLQRELNGLLLTSSELRARERDAILPANRALFDHITRLQELAATKDALASTLNNLVSQLSTIVEQFDALSKGLAEYKVTLSSADTANLSPSAAYEAAKKAFMDNQTLAMSGDATALGKVDTLAAAFLEASKTYFASSPAYYTDIALVSRQVDLAIAAAERAKADAEQVKSDAEKQLEALGLLNNSVTDVKDATQAVRDAVLQLAVASAIELYAKQAADGVKPSEAFDTAARSILSGSMSDTEKASAVQQLGVEYKGDLQAMANSLVSQEAMSLSKSLGFEVSSLSGSLGTDPTKWKAEAETWATAAKAQLLSAFDKFHEMIRELQALRHDPAKHTTRRPTGVDYYKTPSWSVSNGAWVTWDAVAGEINRYWASAFKVAESITKRIGSGGMFANGGAFSNGIVSKPTAFSMGLMGEAGPEAIMPLSRMSDGSLGVAYSGQSDNSELVAELRALRAEVAELKQHSAAGVRVAQAVGKAQIETLGVIADASTDSAKSQRLMELAR